MDHTSHEQADTRENKWQARVFKERGSQQPQGIRKAQSVRQGVRRPALRSCRQAISENKSTLASKILSSPTKDIIPAVEQASQVSPSLPSPPVSQRKRKREEAFADDLGGRSIKPLQSSQPNHTGRSPKASGPSIDRSSRCSTRSQQRRDRESKANSQQLFQIPSPSASSDLDQERRKQDSVALKTESLLPPKPQNPANELGAKFAPADQYNPIVTWIESGYWPTKPQNPAKQLEATSAPAGRYNPILTWIESGYWPTDFAIKGFHMADSSSAKNSAKRPRTSSYSQGVKAKAVPVAYTPEWREKVVAKGIDMDIFKGKQYVSEASQTLCRELQKITFTSIQPSVYPENALDQVLRQCQNRNEALVNRDVTPMLVPPIISLYLHGANYLEHVVDEVNADWDERCVIAGPRLRPDLAVGLFSSAFTSEEIAKLTNYTATDNWTQFTKKMYFPFLMSEVKCGTEGLDAADCQNMHSCSVALKALLRIEQEADKYRLEKKLASRNGQILVFSLSHDQQDARLHGHYALLHGEQWSYHRHEIQCVRLIPNQDGMLALHNFVQNIFKTFLPTHVQRLKDALATFPEPRMLSSAATETTSANENTQETSWNRDADGFVIPGAPASTTRSEESVIKQQMNLLVQQMERLEQERQDGKEREERMQKQIDEMMKLIANTKTTGNPS